MIRPRISGLGVFALSGLLFGVAASTPSLAQDTPGAPPAPVPRERTPVLSYVIVDGASVPTPLTEEPADAERGRAVYFDSERGGCVACHWVQGMDGDRTGFSGPPLDDIGVRLASGVVRLWIINPRALKDGSPMPAYYSLTPEEERVPGDAPERDAPLLTAQEVEDLVAYLNSQSSGGSGSN